MSTWNLNKQANVRKLVATKQTYDDCKSRLQSEGYTHIRETELADGRIQLIGTKGVQSLSRPGMSVE